MSHVMKIKTGEDPVQRAQLTLDEAMRRRQLPQRWIAGSRVYEQLRRCRHSTLEFGTLLGIKVERKSDAPPDLLELDAF